MAVNGFNKTTLLDYPGKIAATIFLGGCNFRCPFCHNSGLVLSSKEQPVIETSEILKTLEKRKGILDGVCISGGEPTLDKNLFNLIDQIKNMGYPIKLDTNGSHPWVVKKLVKSGMIDMVAMDIKTSKENYSKVCGIPSLDISPVLESVDFLLSQTIDYEFRTTVVKELHTLEDFLSIREWISGCRAYYLQAYKDSSNVIKPGFSSYSKRDLDLFCMLLSETIPNVHIRGID